MARSSDPGTGPIGIKRRLRRDPLAGERQRVGLVAEHTGERLAAALADHHNDLALAVLIAAQAAVFVFPVAQFLGYDLAPRAGW